MIKKFQIIICVHVIIGVVFGVTLTQAVVISNQCTSGVEQIYRNVKLCDKQNVTLTGRIVGLTLSVSDSGNKYTTFMLDDATAAPIKVFSYTHLLVSEGDTVKVNGIFYEVFEKSGYKFYMQIVTTPEQIFIVKRAESMLIRVLPVLITLLVTVVVLIAYKKYKSHKISKDIKYESGLAFENYVQSLFDIRYWSIVNYSKDLHKKFGRKIESDSDPDFVIRHKDTDKIIAIECKYRSRFFKGSNEYGITWASDYQIRNYNAFKEKTGYPVFVVIGIGGTPSKPKSMFTVPLYALKFTFASEDYLLKFERSPKNEFTIEEFKKIHTQV